MHNLSKFSRAYGGAEPELVEGDVFRMMIQVPESASESEEQRHALVVSTERKVHDHGPEVTETKVSILAQQRAKKLAGDNSTGRALCDSTQLFDICFSITY